MAPRIFSFLKISPDAEPIADSEEMRKTYRYWRIRVLYATTIGYIFFYLVRKSLAVAMPVIEQEFGIPKSQLGLILTVFGITYGVSRFINGFAGDRTNPRYFMALGLVLSAVINVMFGLSSSIVAFGIFWILNGWFQGMGSPPFHRTLVQWFAVGERGIIFAIGNTAVSIGSALVVILNGYLVVAYGWRSCFFVPAALAFFGALFILNRLRDRPQSLGLPPVEQYADTEPDISDTRDGNETPYKQLVAQYMFKNPLLWIACFANFFVYVIRYSVLDWGTTFLTEARGLDITHAAWIVGGYEVAGIAGMLIGGWALDRVFKGMGGRTCAIYMFFCTLGILAFWKLNIQSVIGNGILLWTVGFMIYGPQCLVGVIAANLVPKNVGAAAIGITGLFGYLSTTLSGWGLGKIVDEYGWNAGFLMMVLASAVGMLLFIALWNSNLHRPGSQAHLDHSTNSKPTGENS